MNVFCLRHTEVDKISRDWIAGKTEVNLTPNGERQALKLATNLVRQYSFDQIYSSPMKRCLHLAEIFRNLTEQEFTIDERLAECDFGQWEGKRLNELYEKNPEIDLFNPPGGESVEEFCERVYGFWREEILNLKSKNILIVAHGGTNSALMVKLTRSSKEKFWDFMQSYGGLNEIEVNGHKEAVIKRHNDVSYLEELA